MNLEMEEREGFLFFKGSNIRVNKNTPNLPSQDPFVYIDDVLEQRDGLWYMSDADGPFNGTHIPHYHFVGFLRELGHYKDGKKCGNWMTFKSDLYSNVRGSVIFCGYDPYIDGERHGVREDLDDDGSIKGYTVFYKGGFAGQFKEDPRIGR